MGTLRGYFEYTGGCSVHHEDFMSTSGAYHDECGEYHEYTERCSLYRKDTMGTLGEYHDEGGRGYHEHTGACSVHWGSYKFYGFINDLPHVNHGSVLTISPSLLQTPSALMISPQCAHNIPQCTALPPPPKCTAQILWQG